MAYLKTCFKCGAQKPVEDFYRHPQMADGHLGKCKECTKYDVKLRYITEPKKIKKYEDKRSKKPERIKKSTIHCREWRAKYPDRYRAHCVVSNAIKTGKVTRPVKCDICGKPCKPHAHHEDYSKPLLIVWSCAECHGQIQ